MRAAVLALQGAFAEHERILEDMGVEYMEIRQEKDAYQDFDALILPGEKARQWESSLEIIICSIY